MSMTAILIAVGVGALGVLFVLWKVFRAGRDVERGRAEGAARETERDMAEEMNRRVDPGESEDKLGDGTF